MADVVVRDAFDIAEAEREQGLGAVEGLDLALLIDAQDDRVVGWIEIEPDDVAHLLDEEGIRGDLEMLLAMRLETERLPHALDGGLGELRLGRDGSAAPMRSVLGLCLERLPDQRGDLLVANRARTTRPRLVVEAWEPLRQVALAPRSDRGHRQTQAFGDVGVALAIGGQQDDSSARREGLRHRSRSRDRDELVALGLRHGQRGKGSTSGHGLPPFLTRQPIPKESDMQSVHGTVH